MKFQIAHTLSYAYSKPVFLEPTTIRLRPRSDCTQNLLAFSLEIRPRPAGQSDCVELEGNSVTRAWFDGLTERLDIRVESTVETLRENPFDYILTGTVSDVFPEKLPESHDDGLRPYRQSGEPSRDVAVFVSELCANGAVAPLEFLNRLISTMGRDFKSVKRLRGEPLSPEECLRTRKGACRDLAVLFMEACRAVGLPVRFVSGYDAGSAGVAEQELHAWAEVYLPGGGWRGYDPSMGLAVANTHIALAAGARPADAAAVTGAFRGSEAEAEMTYTVEIHAV